MPARVPDNTAMDPELVEIRSLAEAGEFPAAIDRLEAWTDAAHGAVMAGSPLPVAWVFESKALVRLLRGVESGGGE